MSEHNYYNTFIEVAEDCPVDEAKVPQPRGNNKTVALLQYEMLAGNPYGHTQEDVLFGVWLDRQDLGDLADDEVQILRQDFFAQGRPCLRASPLTKTHGWGVRFDGQGRAALCALGSPEYEEALVDDGLTVLKAMRSKRR